MLSFAFSVLLVLAPPTSHSPLIDLPTWKAPPVLRGEPFCLSSDAGSVHV